jgi:two-component system, sensor histidine kinase and response regulator
LHRISSKPSGGLNVPAERILVVDDSPTQIEASRALLEAHGYRVVAARSGEEALELVRRQAFDLVLSDVVMPGMSGFELCRHIKHELDRAPPVVLLTSLADPRDIVRGVECGADNYITKPYEPAHLASRIRHVLDNRPSEETERNGPIAVRFLGETFTIESDQRRILALLLSSFEELIRTNAALQDKRRQLAEAHERELRREQEAREKAEADARRMESLKQKAEAAARLRDEVLAAVSHDLKNPLGTIYTSSTLMLEVQLPREAECRQLEIIRRTVQRMDRLIQDLLDVSRMEAHRFTVSPTAQSVSSIMLEAKEMLGTIAAAKKIELAFAMPDEDMLVMADRHRVLQVFSNLIDNAVKFTGEGGCVRVTAEAEPELVRFSVADNGIGIPPEALERIFELFWHGAEGGSGLGLAITKGIVEAHGGRIHARSDATGATFTFSLPVPGVLPGT